MNRRAFLKASGAVAAVAAGVGLPALAGYEEGVWTPTLVGATPADLPVAYSSQIGTYTKFGTEVRVAFSVATSTFTFTTVQRGGLGAYFDKKIA